MSVPLYSVFTFDVETVCVAQNVPRSGLIAVLRELRRKGYSCHYRRDPDGGHSDNDPLVLVKRVDEGKPASPTHCPFRIESESDQVAWAILEDMAAKRVLPDLTAPSARQSSLA